MGPERWRTRAARLFELAEQAHDDGALRWSELLTARAEDCLCKAAELENPKLAGTKSIVGKSDVRQQVRH